MIKKLLLAALCGFLVACSSNPHKAEEIKTELDKKEDAGAGLTMGLNEKGEMVTSQKQKLVDYLKGLQSEVYELESEIYGQEKYGRKGLWGSLRDCLDEARSKKRGGDGKAAAVPKKTVLTLKEDSNFNKIGFDEKAQLVGVKEEYLLDRSKRFENYKENYLKQKDDFEDQLRACKTSLGDIQEVKEN